MTPHRIVRSLAQLERSGSTARVLNLNAIAKLEPSAAGGQAAPLFHNAMLNRSIIIKHRLRRDEQDLFPDHRLLATKLVVPIDSKDLTAGAHFFFMGQRGHAELINNILGPQARFGSHDRMVLKILDQSPTLDPFVLREQLRRNGLEPSPHYFEIGSADLNRMHSFVLRQVQPLAGLTEGEQGRGGTQGAGKLAGKLLSSRADVETEPLRNTLKLGIDDYREGVFCWKGFLYYKWSLEELTGQIAQVATEISRIKLHGAFGADSRAKIETDRARFRQRLAAACEGVRRTIGVYDTAYGQLVESRDPAPFRQFLLNAPALFAELGEGLGAIQHVVSYWRYRFAPASHAGVDVTEFSEILEDFLQGLKAFDPGCEDESDEPRKSQAGLS